MAINLTQLQLLTEQLFQAFDDGDWESAHSIQHLREQTIRQLVERLNSPSSKEMLAETIKDIQAIEEQVFTRANRLQTEAHQKVALASHQRRAINKYQKQK